MSRYFSPTWLERFEKSSIICKAIKKHGHSNFKLEILELCKPEECLAKEQYWLDHSEHEYNILPTAGSLLGYLHTEESKAKMSCAARKRLEKDQKCISNLVPGVGQAVAAAACSKAVLVTNIETGETVSYVSQSQAARELGVSESSIRYSKKMAKPVKGK